ncbi:amidohydrolase family protein [Lentzea flaviverrucosa]|uniref:Imidazolonepropionase n=1 Tax=Lentzea flaviverrucosa TaxID=200379 RepID=A0A1H9VJL6_9PSEU|nr:amidohydrolase family protein [Lentzea flaviverrucosa]RDI23815.1 imidazolonepropionase-like amidohydrolase [Lentzea flaviverrucosa]SES21774.1 Imidazolonepropionase [Lentzea flaviverrucosa]
MLALRAGRAFDGERSVPGPVTVLVEDGKITAVEQGRPDVTGAEVVDLGTATVLPGLIDTHVHLCADSENGALDRLPDFTSEHLDAVIRDSLDRQLRAGVTTVRDLGDRQWSVLDQRSRHRQRVLASGPPITSPRGHCWSMGGETSGDDALREAVRERAERRADVVKVMASGGFATPGTAVGDCQFTEHELRVVVEESHAHGLPVTAHAHSLAAVQRAVAAGVDGIEHCTCLTNRGMQMPVELMDALAEAGIAVCHTLGNTQDPPPHVMAAFERAGMSIAAKLNIVGLMHDHGVKAVSGTDGGIGAGKPHGITAHALGHMIEAGVPNAAVLAGATSQAAKALGLRKGLLRPGWDADVIAVQGDPVRDITALHHVTTVVIGGQIVTTVLPADRRE